MRIDREDFGHTWYQVLRVLGETAHAPQGSLGTLALWHNYACAGGWEKHKKKNFSFLEEGDEARPHNMLFRVKVHFNLYANITHQYVSPLSNQKA